MNKIIKNTLPIFLPLALSITLMCGLFYTVVQQNYRISANDPQIQIAEDISTQLNSGVPAIYFIPNIKIDISKSLGTFIMIYNSNRQLIGTSGLLNGKALQIPQGVFAATKQKGEERLTWQPQKGVRIALVMDYYPKSKGGFVAIGRSLKEVEVRIDNLGKMILAGWLASLILLFLLILFIKKSSNSREH